MGERYPRGTYQVCGGAREDIDAIGGEKEDKHKSHIYQITVLSSKLDQAVLRETKREGAGCLLPDDQCTKTRRLLEEVIWEKHPTT